MWISASQLIAVLVWGLMAGALVGARLMATWNYGTKSRLELWRKLALHYRAQRINQIGPFQAMAERYRTERDELRARLARLER